jgi:hypothetical protein
MNFSYYDVRTILYLRITGDPGGEVLRSRARG